MRNIDYIITHKRFKKRFNKNELNKYLYKKNRIIRYPEYRKNYYSFFSSFAKKKYKLIKNNCLCGGKNDILLSQTDRHCVDFVTVVCKNCGLIRALDYFRNEDVEDFYKNFYRTKAYNEDSQEISLEEIFNIKKKNSKFQYDLINKHKIKNINKLKIVDVGGGIGAVLDHFHNSNTKYLVDYYDPYLRYAMAKGIKIIKGGIDNIDFKPDIIILSHVIEHWNNFECEIQKLIKIQKKNLTLNYIEFPGVDSIKNGRREGDILGDIHVPHVYYFCSYVFENLMNRYGFKKIYLDSFIKSIFIYNGERKSLINYFELCRSDLIASEKTRKLQILKNLIKLFMPIFILRLIRKIINLKIQF